MQKAAIYVRDPLPAPGSITILTGKNQPEPRAVAVNNQRHSPGPDGDQTSKTQPVQLRCSDSPERRWPTGSEPLANRVRAAGQPGPSRWPTGSEPLANRVRAAGQPGPSRWPTGSEPLPVDFQRHSPGPDGDQTSRPNRYNSGVRTHRRGAGQPGPSRCLLISSATARALTEIRPVRPNRYNSGVRTHRRGAGQPGPRRCHQRHSPGPDGDQTSRPKRYNSGVRTHRRGAGQPGPRRCHQRHSPGPDGDQTSKTQAVQLRCSDSPERRWPTGSEVLPPASQPGP